jgi:outer membrane receptor protein involved in Fe transport
LLAVPAAAQTGGVVSGTVRDAQGGVLPGVTLSLRNVETGVTRTVVTEADGTYRLAGVQPGRYDMTAELAGFANAEVRDMTINIGLALQRDVTMSLQALQESVTVTAEAPVIEITRTDVAQVITQEQIDTLPMSDRQPASLVLLLPGTNMDNTQVRRAQANIGAGGINNQMNAYFVDGASNWSTNSGQQHAEMPQMAVREFRVNVAQASAEHGGNVAGLVSTVTRSGTNRFSGEVLEYFRDDSLNAITRDQLAVGNEKPDYRRNQWGVGFGGPIIQDRAHFYGAIEWLTENKSFTVNSGVPQFYSALHGTFPTDYLRRKYFIRGDIQLTSQQSLFARYALDKERIDCEACGGSNAAFFDVFVESPRDTLVTGHTWVISSSTLNDLRVQWPARLRHATGPPGTEKWSEPGEFPDERFVGYTQVYNFPSFHWGSSSNSLNHTNRFELKEDFSHVRGQHQLKFGGEYAQYISPEDVTGNRGTWTFSQDQFFDGSAASIAALRNPTLFTASFPHTERKMQNYWINWYAQDEWKPRNNLTLNVGLRYDLQYHSFNNQLDLTGRERLSEFIDPDSRGDYNNFGPRVGFAWDVNDNGQSVVRGAYGRFYQYLPQGSLRGEQTTLLQNSINITNPSYPDPYGGLSPQAFVTVSARPNITILDDDIENASGDTATLGVSQQLRENLALHVDGVYTNLRGIARTQNINQPVPLFDPRNLTAQQAATISTFTAAQLNARRPLANWGNVTQLVSNAWHDYRALYVRLDKRFANSYQYLVSYTREWTTNNTGNITNFYDPEQDTGPSGRKHQFVASGYARLPLELTLGAVWTVRSALPYDASSGVDLAGGGVTTRVPGVTRNMAGRDDEGTARMLELVNAWRAVRGRAPIPASQLESSDFNRVDMRLSRSFAVGAGRDVEVLMQVFNLFGRDNLIGGTGGAFVNNALSDSFGRYTVAGARREMEVGIRFRF